MRPDKTVCLKKKSNQAGQTSLRQTKTACLSGKIQVLDRITRPPRAAVESYSTAAFPALCRTVQPEREKKKTGQLKADMSSEILNFSKDYQGGFIVCGPRF